MIRGRADGSGRPFNLGEATVTRCVLGIEDTVTGEPLVGVGYVLGRSKRQAELIAKFDAAFQDSGDGESLRNKILPPLSQVQRLADSETDRKTAATRVDFFTMVRGE